jgi:hypothetical protein
MSVVSKVKKDKRKIKSTKTTIDGIEFDSILEGYCYKCMTIEGFEFVIKPKYEILPEFKYQGKKIQNMVWTPDFYLPSINTIVETKGRANESFPVRLKIFLWRHCKLNGGTEPKIVILKNQKEVRDFIIEYKEHFK